MNAWAMVTASMSAPVVRRRVWGLVLVLLVGPQLAACAHALGGAEQPLQLRRLRR